jgi:hypothetical protein
LIIYQRTEVLTDEALTTQRAILQLPEPAERTKNTQADWFRGDLDIDTGIPITQFIDGSAHIFDADIVSIGTITSEQDFFSRWLPAHRGSW